MELKSIQKALADRIKEIRKAKGLRQEDMETRGINYKYYQRIEAGNVNLTIKTIEKIASALNTSITDIFRFPFTEEVDAEAEVEEVIALINQIISANDKEAIRKLKVFIKEILSISMKNCQKRDIIRQ